MRKLLQRVRRAQHLTPGAADATAPPPDSTTPPPGATVATYADVIAGGDLRVAFREGAVRRLALRVGQDGEVIPVPAETHTEGQDLVSARVDLTEVAALPADERWTYDVVLVDESGNADHLWVSPSDLPTIALPAGHRQFRIRRGPAGFLKVQHVPLAPAAELIRIGGDDRTIDLVFPADTEGDLLLLEDDQVLTTFPLRGEGDERIATLSTESIPLGAFKVATVAVGSAGEWRPVRRRRNGLADPRGAVPLPDLFGDDDLSVVRLRYNLAGEVIVKTADPPLTAGKESA